MALSKKDQLFYEEKLNWRTFGSVFIATSVLGAIMWPGSAFYLDWSDGQAGKWNFNIFFNDAVMGFMLGSIMTIVLYLFFKFFLAMGWLPSRQ